MDRLSPSLFFTVPLVALTVLSSPQHPTLVWFAFAAFSLIAILIAVLGLALHASPAFIAAEAVSTSLLTFTVGASTIVLVNRYSHLHALYNIALATILFCASLSSVLAPFLTPSFPPLLAPLFSLASSLLPFPLILTLLLASHNSPSSPSASPPREKVFDRDEPLTVYLRAVTSSADDRDINQSTPLPLHIPLYFRPFLICAQLSAVLASAFAVSIHSLPAQAPPASVLRILQSISIIIWVIFTMFALLIHPQIHTETIQSSSNLTPPPTRLAQSLPNHPRSRPQSPPNRAYYPCPTRPRRVNTQTAPTTPTSPSIPVYGPSPGPSYSYNNYSSGSGSGPGFVRPNSAAHPPTPTPSQLTEDFLSLRDPFASPNIGVALALDTNVNPTSFHSSSSRHSAIPARSPTPSPSKSNSTRSKSKAGGRSTPPPLSPRNSSRPRIRNKISARTPPPPPTSPAPHAPLPSLPSGGSTSTLVGSPVGGSAEDVDFDTEEAFLTQLLLQNLDARARARSVSGSGSLFGAPAPTPATATATATAPSPGGVANAGSSIPRAVSVVAAVVPRQPQAVPPTRTRTHRFTQDSTSTGRTLCDSEAFKLPRGSVSTEFGSSVGACVGGLGGGSPPVSPGSLGA